MNKTEMKRAYEAPKCDVIDIKPQGALLVASGESDYTMQWAGAGESGEYGD